MSQSGTQRPTGAMFRSTDLDGTIARAFMRGTGRSDAVIRRSPVIGVVTSWSELNPCNAGLRDLAEHVRRGVMAAGGACYELPTISIAEPYVRPTSMYLRNLMAMDVEEVVATAPIDGVVLLGGCDKTIPAQVMGALSADKPATVLAAGPRAMGCVQGEEASVDDLWRFEEAHRRGDLDDDGMREVEGGLNGGIGTCNVLGTAATMAAIAEALGLSLPGTALLPATSAARGEAAEATGAAAVALARTGVGPGAIVTRAALENAVRVMAAINGSTNALIHLLAIAGRVGIDLELSRIGELCRTTPVLTNVRPVGTHSLADLDRAGGIPAVMHRLGDLVDTGQATVSGTPWQDQLVSRGDSPALATRDDPVATSSGLAVLRGSLVPDGAVIKTQGADPRLLTHRGPALVFDGVVDLATRIDTPELPVTPDSVLVLRGVGPRGGPAMPEVGRLPIPKKLLAEGCTDMLRISDGRMSGTAIGAVVLHATPESAVGGPLALVRDGDLIEIDADAGRLDLLVATDELAARREALQLPPGPARGYERLHHDHVMQADHGCDFDFLQATGTAVTPDVR